MGVQYLTKLPALSIKAPLNCNGIAGIMCHVDRGQLKALQSMEISGPVVLDGYMLRPLSEVKCVDLQYCGPCVGHFNALSNMPTFVVQHDTASQRRALFMHIASMMCLCVDNLTCGYYNSMKTCTQMLIV